MNDNKEEFKAETEPSLDFSSEDSFHKNPIDEHFQRELEQVKAEDQLNSTAPEVESKAKQFGHLSKEQWEAQGRDPSLWKSPEEFVKYGEDFKETRDLIKQLKQQNQEYSKKIDILVEAHKQTAETAVQQARRELEHHLRQAKERGDTDAVERLAQQKVNMDIQNQQANYQKKLEEVRQVDEAFMERNKHWFNASRPDLMQKVAIISQDMERFYPGITYSEKAHRIEERMKFEHPEIVINHITPPPPISMSNSNVNKSVAEHGTPSEERMVKSLSAEERAELAVIKSMVEKATKGKATYTATEYIERNKADKNRGR